MNRLRSLTTEIPHCVHIEITLNRMTFESVEKVRSLDWVPYKEHWEVYTYHVIVSFFCIELDSEPSNISELIRRATRSYSC